MKKTRALLGILAVIIFVGGAIIIFAKKDMGPRVPVQSGTVAVTTVPTATYGMAEVAAHNSASSCWTAINGGVYDVTAWISKHPGGAQAILGLCGKDGSSAFDGQHGGQRRPEQELASFQIGTLTK